MKNELLEYGLGFNRRRFLSKMSLGIGSVALGSLLIPDLFGEKTPEDMILSGLPHFAPKAKRVIYLFQNGAPSQLDLFDYKPKLQEMFGQDLPESIRNGQRLTGMTADQKKFPLAGSVFKFGEYGQAKNWMSELLPHTAKVVDDLCVIRSMYTEAINHDPALTFLQTGAQVGNRPSMGSWLSYGLGSENKNLPAFCVLLSKGKGNGQGVYSKLWSNGFLDSVHQGVQFSSGDNPVLYLNNPEDNINNFYDDKNCAGKYYWFGINRKKVECERCQTAYLSMIFNVTEWLNDNNINPEDIKNYVIKLKSVGEHIYYDKDIIGNAKFKYISN